MARRRRGEVGREDYARTALRIADEEGVDRLTIRRLAEVAGVGTMTVYSHFGGKDEVLEAAVDAASAPVEPLTTGTWRERLEQLILTTWEALETHPAIVEIRLRRPVVRPDALCFGEAAMALLLETGLSHRDASQSFRLLFTYTFGFAALSPGRRADAARASTDAAVGALDPDRFPSLLQARKEFADAAAGRDTFAFGLAVILDGLEQRTGAGSR